MSQNEYKIFGEHSKVVLTKVQTNPHSMKQNQILQYIKLRTPVYYSCEYCQQSYFCLNLQMQRKQPKLLYPFLSVVKTLNSDMKYSKAIHTILYCTSIRSFSYYKNGSTYGKYMKAHKKTLKILMYNTSQKSFICKGLWR